jgi:Zn-dependent membrane protease YugP
MLRFGKPKSGKANQNRDVNQSLKRVLEAVSDWSNFIKQHFLPQLCIPILCGTVPSCLTLAVSSNITRKLLKLLFIGIIITNVMFQLFTIPVEYSPTGSIQVSN